MQNHTKPIIGITQCYELISSYGEIRTALDIEWSSFFTACGFRIRLLAHGEDFKKQLQDVHGVVLSGGNDLHTYTFNRQNKLRDQAEERIVQYCIMQKIPILGVCRGMLFLNHFFSGTLERVNGHVAQEHLLNSGQLVNSFHNWHISSLGDDLIVTDCSAEDQSPEAMQYEGLAIKGIMWHPERTKMTGKYNDADIQLFKEHFYPL